MMSGEIEVRAFEAGDTDGVVALWNRVFADDPPWNEPRLVIARKLRVQPELFFVALQGSAVVGTALAGFDGCRGQVHHVGVAPEARRLGVGRKLMEAAALGLRGLGAPKLNLQVRAGNEAALRFYRALGFAVEERMHLSLHLDAGHGV